MKKILAIAAVIMMLGPVNGCLNDVEEVQLDYAGLDIPAPSGITAQVGDGTVYLVWRSVPDAASYRIYRSSAVSAEPVRIAQTADTAHTDDGLVNGRVYYYSISSVNGDGVEGKRSDEIAAVPSIHSVIINGGLLYTNSRDVVLSLTAPPTTALMMIGRDASFTGAVWETFSSTRSWRLNEGDGQKSVYAKFQDQGGAISPVVSASITLDTYAEIESLEMIADIPLAPGGSARFTMDIVDLEIGGEAAVTIEGTSLQIILEDLGDGTYETVYTFPTSTRGTDMTVTGWFKDQAGNQAVPLEIDETLSFTDPPESVYLHPVADSTVSSISLRWDTYAGDYFRSYKLYRDTEPGVDNTSRIVSTISNINTSTYTDAGLIEHRTYYYRIYVVNDLDEMTGSNERVAHTFDAYPTAVILDSLSAIGDDRLTLTWSKNTNTDFHSYRIYYSLTPGVTLESPSIGLQPWITDRDSTYFDHTGIDNINETYYYRVYVFDDGGKFSRSNEMSTEGH